jgi:hypothetical protein
MQARDVALPKWQRLSKSLQAFSGLELTTLTEDVRRCLEQDLAGINGVLARYEFATYEDCQAIDAADLEALLTKIEAAASRAIDSELDRIVAHLDAGVEKLPIDAIYEAREHRDLMVPRLIEVLRDATAAAREGAVPEGNAHFFAVFLLTEFRAEEGFPAILEAFSLPGELLLELFGDVVTSTLARILALLAADRSELLDGMIGDRALNMYVRWEAARAHIHLVRDGRLTCDQAVSRLQRQLRQAIERKDVSIVTPLICEIELLSPRAALEDVVRAFEQDVVDTGFADLEGVKRSIAAGDTKVQQELDRCPPAGTDDTVEELKHWAGFESRPKPRQPAPLPAPDIASSRQSADRLNATVVSHGPRIGRNAHCYNSSGKQFKKCCGARNRSCRVSGSTQFQLRHSASS